MNRAWPLACLYLMTVLGLRLMPTPRELSFVPAPPNAALTLPPRSTLSPLQKLLAGLKLDINQATVAELRALPDLGDGLAQAIAAARRAKPLGCEAELLRISGLGASRLRRVLPYLKPLPRRCSSAEEGLKYLP